MIDPVRQEIVALAHTIVVKIGTNVLTGADGTLDFARLQSLADQVQRHVRQRDVLFETIIVVAGDLRRAAIGDTPRLPGEDVPWCFQKR